MHDATAVRAAAKCCAISVARRGTPSHLCLERDTPSGTLAAAAAVSACVRTFLLNCCILMTSGWVRAAATASLPRCF